MCYNSHILHPHALVAQLDSVSASDAEGCGFDPRRVHQMRTIRTPLLRSSGFGWFFIALLCYNATAPTHFLTYFSCFCIDIYLLLCYNALALVGKKPKVEGIRSSTKRSSYSAETGSPRAVVAVKLRITVPIYSGRLFFSAYPARFFGFAAGRGEKELPRIFILPTANRFMSARPNTTKKRSANSKPPASSNSKESTNANQKPPSVFPNGSPAGRKHTKSRSLWKRPTKTF